MPSLDIQLDQPRELSPRLRSMSRVPWPKACEACHCLGEVWRIEYPVSRPVPRRLALLRTAVDRQQGVRGCLQPKSEQMGRAHLPISPTHSLPISRPCKWLAAHNTAQRRLWVRCQGPALTSLLQGVVAVARIGYHWPRRSDARCKTAGPLSQVTASLLCRGEIWSTLTHSHTPGSTVSKPRWPPVTHPQLPLLHNHPSPLIPRRGRPCRHPDRVAPPCQVET